MGKRNQVTTDLKIAASAELKNSKSFISQLDSIMDKFDLGDKVNAQLISAKEQVKELNKILEKVQFKSIISDDELKTLTKAGKDIANIIAKTEKLYSGFNSADWNKYSKEYIAKIKKQEEEILKIKEEYQKKTGKNYDKEIANYDKILAKNKELKAQREQLAKTGVDDLATKQVEQLNQKLDAQKEKLRDIIALKEKSERAFQTAANQSAQENGFKDYNTLKNTKILSDKQVTRQFGTELYNQEKQALAEMSRLIKEIEQDEKDVNAQNATAIEIAKRYNLENVKDLATLKEQHKIRKDILKTFSNDKSRLALQYETELNAKLNEQLRIRNALAAATQAGQTAQTAVLGERTKQSLNASYTATNKSIANLQSQLSENGIETIVNTATTTVAGLLRQIDADIKVSNGELNSLDETNEKLATQSERAADDLDIKEMGTSVNSNIDTELNATEKEINDWTSKTANGILKNLIPSASPTEYDKLVKKYNSPVEFDTKSMGESYSAAYDVINTNLQKFAAKEITAEELQKVTEEQKEIIRQVLINTREGIFVALQNLDDERQTIIDGAKDRGFTDKEEKDLEILNQYTDETTKDLIKLDETIDLINKDFLTTIKSNVQQVVKQQEIPSYTKDINKLSENLTKAANQSAYLGSTFDDIKNKIGYFLSLNYVFDQVTRKITEAIQVTREMDKDMTQIGLVLGKTSGQVWKNFDTYSKMAGRLNTTTSQVANSMKLFYQQGLNTSEVNKMVEASAIAAALGESTMAEASETLTSILNSYNLTASEAMTITDKISQIAIVSAADFGELSIAIEKVASSAATAGLDLDHMMGYLAKMIETTREAPTNIGTALKTIVANFTQFKEDPTGLAEEGSEINKVDKALKSVGISLTNANGEVRDLGEVIDELGKSWDRLNRNQKAYLATAIAGTRQQSRFYALMNDYDRTLELVAEGSNSAGKAQQQFALYSNSLEAATNRLTNEWEKFFNSLTQGNGAIVHITNSLTSLMKIINVLGPGNTLVGLISLINSARKGVDWFHELNEKVRENHDLTDGYRRKVSTLNTMFKKGEIDKDTRDKIRKELKEEYTKDYINNADYFGKSGPVAEKYKKRIISINAQHKKWTKHIDENWKHFKKFGKTSTGVLTNIKKGFAAVPPIMSQVKQAAIDLTSHFAMMLVAQTALKAITAMFEGFKSVLNINTAAYVELSEKASENQSTIEGLRAEYENLTNKISLTQEEQKRLKEITEEVIEVDAQLGLQLKANGNEYKENIKLMKEYEKQQSKIAANQSTKAILSEASPLANWNLLLRKETYMEWLGSYSEQNALKQEEYSNWRTLSGNKAVTEELDENQTALLTHYSEQLIKNSEAANQGAIGIRSSTTNFSEALDDFIEKIKGMTDSQLTEFDNINTILNDNDKNHLEKTEAIAYSYLPSEIKQQLYNQEIERNYQMNQKATEGNVLLNEEGEKAIHRSSDVLTEEQFKKLFIPDNADLLSESEIAQYQKAIAEIFNDEKTREEFEDAMYQGGQAVTNFINGLPNTAENNILKTVFKGLESLEQMADKASQALEKLQETIDSDFLTGKASQMDILSGVVNNEIDIRDIKTIRGATGNILSIDITRQIAEMEAYKNNIIKLFDEKIKQQQLDIDNYTPKKVKRKNEQGQEVEIITYGFIEKARTETEIARGNLEEQKEIKKGYEQDLTKTTAEKNQLQFGIDQKVKQTQKAYPLINVTEEMVMTDEERKKIGELKKKEEELKKSIEATNTEIETQESKYNELVREQERYEEIGEKLIKNEDGLQDELNSTVQALKNEQQQIINTKKAIEEYLDRRTKNQRENTAVFNEYANFNQIINELDIMSQAVQATDGSIQGMITTIELLSSNSELADYLLETADYTKFSQKAITDASKQMIKDRMNNVDAEIASTEAIISLIEARLQGQKAEVKGKQQQTDNIKTEIGKVIAYEDSKFKTDKAVVENESQQIKTSIANWATWSLQAQTAIKEVSDRFAEYVRKRNEESPEAVGGPETKVNLSGIQDVKSADTGLTDAQYKSDAEGFIDKLNSLDPADSEDSAELEAMLGRYKKQLKRLKLLKGTYKELYNNVGSYLKDPTGKNSGGSDDAYEKMVEKLEHFYNYLRQIEALEAKINKIREKRTLIDATKNYYIDDLAEENELLREQASLYGNYIDDEIDYLAELRDQLLATYGDWVYFNDEGVIQVKQTEFEINSEEEEERYNTFSELLSEYENEYNTMLENQNNLYTIQATIVENITTMYDKYLQKLTDVAEQLEYINSISEHKVEMSFGSIEKLPLLSEQIKTTADMLLYAQKSMNELEGDFKTLNETIRNSDFTSLLNWDETQQQWFVNNEAMEDEKVKKQFEDQGYNWEDIVTWVNATAGASQKIADSMKDVNGQLMSSRENLKGLLDERISTIDEIFEKATEEINKFYDIYDKKIAQLGTENDLFGVESSNLEQQFEYLMTGATHAKALLQGLKENNTAILDTLMKDYGQYVDMIDGVAYINKMAIEESTTLTEGQKAELLQLYQLYYDSKDQIDEMNDKFYEYISQIQEMEEAKRDAIIDLKNQVYEELMRIDQKEIDDLSEKYQKMSELDSEYYSKLQQRINDARDARSRLQNQQNLTQMQNRLSVLQQDNSGQYNSELVELQRQINEQLQAQADENVNLEMERIAREQQQREEDRNMQITQMENLLTFKDENGIYWIETQGIIESGNASIIGLLTSSDEYQRLSTEEQHKQLETLQDTTKTASTDFSSHFKESGEYEANLIRENLEELVKGPIDKIVPAIKEHVDDTTDEVTRATTVFINTMSGLFRLLNEEQGKTEAGGYTTGMIDKETGIYTPPTKKPKEQPKKETPKKETTTTKPTLKKGSYVQVKSGQKWYYDSYGTSPTGTARSGTIKYINTKGSHPYNIDGLGWIKKSSIVGYSKGGYVDYTGIAAVHGKSNKPEAFLNAKQTALFEALRNALVKTQMGTKAKEDIGNNENIVIENLTIDVKELADTDSIDKVIKNVKDSIYKDATSGNNMKIRRR